jgi:hypothetical protein
LNPYNGSPSAKRNNAALRGHFTASELPDAIDKEAQSAFAGRKDRRLFLFYAKWIISEVLGPERVKGKREILQRAPFPRNISCLNGQFL